MEHALDSLHLQLKHAKNSNNLLKDASNANKTIE